MPKIPGINHLQVVKALTTNFLSQSNRLLQFLVDAIKDLTILKIS
ncbi:MAG: hypothetical protein ACRC2R_04300 [Xenococcaceae cyanobacterium]